MDRAEMERILKKRKNLPGYAANVRAIEHALARQNSIDARAKEKADGN